MRSIFLIALAASATFLSACNPSVSRSDSVWKERTFQNGTATRGENRN